MERQNSGIAHLFIFKEKYGNGGGEHVSIVKGKKKVELDYLEKTNKTGGQFKREKVYR